VVDLFKASKGDSEHGVHFTGNNLEGGQDWSIMSQYGQLVTFINEAIEWENVVYFLYSYFWDIPTSWKFIRGLQHQDSTRQAFLRAGSARVVLTIRKGFETAFTWLTEHGNLDMPTPIPPSPYLTIAQQIEAYDSTNYPGIPPANPAGGVNVGGQHAGTISVSMVFPGENVIIMVEDASGFVEGHIAVVDSVESGVQERPRIVKVDMERKYLIVEKLLFQHGSKNKVKFPIYQAGERGLLIAEWFEYTPSHGTHIAINSAMNVLH